MRRGKSAGSFARPATSSTSTAPSPADSAGPRSASRVTGFRFPKRSYESRTCLEVKRRSGWPRPWSPWGGWWGSGKGRWRAAAASWSSTSAPPPSPSSTRPASDSSGPSLRYGGEKGKGRVCRQAWRSPEGELFQAHGFLTLGPPDPATQRRPVSLQTASNHGPLAFFWRGVELI